MAFSTLIFFSSCFCVLLSAAATVRADNKSKKVLFILTNVGQYPGTNISTGWYLPEVARPYRALIQNGFELDAVSSLGGLAPLDEGSRQRYQDDEDSAWFLADSAATDFWHNTKKPSDVKPLALEYAAVFYPGGRGPIYDLADNEEIANITTLVYENGGIVAALCHGPVGLIPVKLSDGTYFVEGRKLTGFTNAEEEAVGAAAFLPTLLETELINLGAEFSHAGLGEEHVVVDGRLVTGQNPNSTDAMTVEFLKLLNQ